MDNSKMFIKTKFFLLKNKTSLIISAFLTAPIAVVTCIVFYSLTSEAYSYKNLLFTTPIAFILLIWIVWFIINNSLSQAFLNFLEKFWTVFLIFYIVLFAFLYKGLYRQNLDYIKPPNFYHKVQITPSDDSSGSICIREVKNAWGQIREVNESVYDLDISGGWERYINNCQYFIDELETGAINFTNIGPLDDKLFFILGTHPNAGKLLIRTNGSKDELIDLHYAIGDDRIQVVGLAPNSHIIFWNIIYSAGWSLIICILLVAIYGVFEKITILNHIGKNSLLIILPLIICVIIMFWRPWSKTTSDSALYLSLAKNLYHGAGYVNVDLSPALFRGPVFPLLITISYYLFGEAFRSALIMERIFWALTVLVSYLIGRKLYNQRTGFLAALFVLSAGVINRTFYFIWTDGPLVFATLGLQLMFWQVYKNQRGAKWYALMGFLMGTTYLLKQTVLFIAPLPLAAWVLFSEYRTRVNFKRLLLFYLVIAVFFFGWIGYKYLTGGSAGQAAKDLLRSFNMLTEFLSSLFTLNIVQATSTQAVKSESGWPSLIQIFTTFYKRDIAQHFQAASVLIMALVYTLYQAIWRKNRADIFMVTGLLLFSILMIPIQVKWNYGTRHNMYFYCTVLIITAAMFDRIFLKLPKIFSNYMAVLTSAFFLYSLASAGVFENPDVAQNPRTLDYFSNSTDTAIWVETHIAPDEKILITSKEGNRLHILTSGNRQFEKINICNGERSISIAEHCEPPYISFWVNRGTINPDNPRDYFVGISEPPLISEIQEKDVKYIIVTPRYYSLYSYLVVHPDFEEVTVVDDNVIFRVIHPVQPISSYPDVVWETCIGQRTPAYLTNLAEKNPEKYETRLREILEPWMGLTAQDLETFKNWQGCTFEENFPGEYRLP